MDKIIGLGFCGIAAYLYASAHSAAAAFAPNITSWSHPAGDKWGTRFAMALEQTGGDSLVLWAKISLVAGLVFLIKGLRSDRKARRNPNSA